MKSRITNAVLGMNSVGAVVNSLPIEFDSGEYFIHIHPSGHLLVELPDQQMGFMKFDDLENGVMKGFIPINFWFFIDDALLRGLSILNRSFTTSSIQNLSSKLK